jgi:hypothetical protein
MNLYQPNKSIVSVKTFDEGVDIVYREHSNQMLLCYPPRNAPDRVYREEWRIIGGTLQLDKTVEGKHNPSHYVEESIEF